MDGEQVLLEGRSQNGALSLGFPSRIGIRADFALQGTDAQSGELCLRGSGDLELSGIRIEAATIEVTPAGISVSSTRWGDTECALRLQLAPGAPAWTGTFAIGWPVDCALTPAARLDLSLRIDGPALSDGRARCIGTVTLDELAFDLSVDPWLPAMWPRLRETVTAECEQRLLQAIRDLEAEVSRRGDSDWMDAARRTLAAWEHSLRHSGCVRRRPLPIATSVLMGITPLAGRTAPPQSGSYLGPSVSAGIGSGYLPSDAGLCSVTPATEDAMSSPAGGYLPASSYLSAPGAAESLVPVETAAAAAPFLTRPRKEAARPAPTLIQPGCAEHQARRRLLRCKDLLGALRP